MKSLILLWNNMAESLGHALSISTIRDIQYIAERTEHEKLSFLTITLPAFGKDLTRALEEGRTSSDHFVGFRRHGKLPSFLGGFLDRVFDRVSGDLLPDPCTDSIFSIRQLTLVFEKMELPYSDARLASAMFRFMQCEKEVKEADIYTPRDSRMEFRRISLLLFSDVLTDLDRNIWDGDVHPRHGPGATADRLLGNEKFDLTEWPRRLEQLFSYGEYAFPSLGRDFSIEGDSSLLDRVHFLEPGEERPVKVTPVPKTLKTPRIIAIEPTAMQYMQQGIMGALVPKLQGEILECSGKPALVTGLIGFRDQTPNRVMARKGSRDCDLATLDLSDASDRVSNQHVMDMVDNFSFVKEGLSVTRSMKADVPGHGIITLAKFASMGSALCFPVEAMVFLTIVFLGIERNLGHRLSRKDIKSFRGKVRVYGDDIVVPTAHAQSVIESLEAFGLVVNRGKSFLNGKFRESCGAEYYDGVDVTITRMRRELPSSLKDVQEVESLVSFRNQLYNAGLWDTCRIIDEKLMKILHVFPIVDDTSPALGRISQIYGWKAEAGDTQLHSPLVKACIAVSVPPKSLISGHGALVKCLGKRGQLPIADPLHLERQGRPSAVRILRKYVSPF